MSNEENNYNEIAILNNSKCSGGITDNSRLIANSSFLITNLPHSLLLAAENAPKIVNKLWSLVGSRTLADGAQWSGIGLFYLTLSGAEHSGDMVISPQLHSWYNELYVNINLQSPASRQLGIRNEELGVGSKGSNEPTVRLEPKVRLASLGDEKLGVKDGKPTVESERARGGKTTRDPKAQVSEAGEREDSISVAGSGSETADSRYGVIHPLKLPTVEMEPSQEVSRGSFASAGELKEQALFWSGEQGADGERRETTAQSALPGRRQAKSAGRLAEKESGMKQRGAMLGDKATQNVDKASLRNAPELGNFSREAGVNYGSVRPAPRQTNRLVAVPRILERGIPLRQIGGQPVTLTELINNGQSVETTQSVGMTLGTMDNGKLSIGQRFVIGRNKALPEGFMQTGSETVNYSDALQQAAEIEWLTETVNQNIGDISASSALEVPGLRYGTIKPAAMRHDMTGNMQPMTISETEFVDRFSLPSSETDFDSPKWKQSRYDEKIGRPGAKQHSAPTENETLLEGFIQPANETAGYLDALQQAAETEWLTETVNQNVGDISASPAPQTQSGRYGTIKPAAMRHDMTGNMQPMTITETEFVDRFSMLPSETDFDSLKRKQSRYDAEEKGKPDAEQIFGPVEDKALPAGFIHPVNETAGYLDALQQAAETEWLTETVSKGVEGKSGRDALSRFGREHITAVPLGVVRDLGIIADKTGKSRKVTDSAIAQISLSYDESAATGDGIAGLPLAPYGVLPQGEQLAYNIAETAPDTGSGLDAAPRKAPGGQVGRVKPALHGRQKTVGREAPRMLSVADIGTRTDAYSSLFYREQEGGESGNYQLGTMPPERNASIERSVQTAMNNAKPAVHRTETSFKKVDMTVKKPVGQTAAANPLTDPIQMNRLVNQVYEQLERKMLHERRRMGL